MIIWMKALESFRTKWVASRQLQGAGLRNQDVPRPGAKLFLSIL